MLDRHEAENRGLSPIVLVPENRGLSPIVPIVYWQANARDARGNLVEVALGNGNTTIRDYNTATGYLESVLTGTTLGTEAQSLSFAWDKVGNLVSRTDENQNGLVEDFQYDNLNRLVQATITQGPSYIEPLYVDYDEIGNIVYKSDVGEYNYNTRPHAVSEVIDGPRNATYSYDANGNMTSGADRAIQWTAFNKPRAIVRDSNPPSGTFYNGGTLYASNASAFFYGPDRSRYKQLRNQETNDGFLQSTIVYVGGIYEHHDKANAPDEDRAYIQAGGQTIAIRIERDNNDNDTEYLHRDHLGSVTAMTDSSGNVGERYSYDAFGKRRFDDWFANPSDSLLYDLAIEPRRGFTGHEHLDNVGLIHMNGRVYDPILGRFTSPDTFVQFPETTQGFNRYTYVNNNPLSYADPSGHFIGVSAAAIGSFIAANSTQIAVSAALITAGEVFDEPLLTQVGFAVLAPVSGGNPFGAAAIGFGSGFTASGGNLKAGLYSAATAATFAGVGGAFEEGGFAYDTLGGENIYVAKVVTHGVVGGAFSELRGGSFSDGLIGASVGSALSPVLGADAVQDLGRSGRIIIAATIGGTASELSGGKFANGAAAAAFAQGFNDASHPNKNRMRSDAETYINKKFNTAVRALRNSFNRLAAKFGFSVGGTASAGRYALSADMAQDFGETAQGRISASYATGSYIKAVGTVDIIQIGETQGLLYSMEICGGAGLGGCATADIYQEGFSLELGAGLVEGAGARSAKVPLSVDDELGYSVQP